MSGSGNAHPAWEPLLAKIPESLRELVKPVFIEFDNQVQQTLTQKNDELKKYEAFKPFIDNNVDAEWLQEAADFAYRAEKNPKELFEQANKAWNLGFLTAEEAQAQSSNNQTGGEFDSDDPELGNMDITQHPQFRQLADKLNELTGQVTEFTSNSEAEQQQREWDSFLKQQHDEGKQFNDDFVTALVANGMPFEKALDQYNDLVANVVGNNENNESNEQAGQETKNSDGTAPVVMGGDGSGSGTPNEPISFGTMNSGDLEDTVAQMIASLNQDPNNS